MFDITKFIMDTLKGMKGTYPDFQIREYALNWYGKGNLQKNILRNLKNIFQLSKKSLWNQKKLAK